MSSVQNADLAAALAGVARALAAEKELAAVFLRACRLAVETIDACDHADLLIVAPVEP